MTVSITDIIVLIKDAISNGDKFAKLKEIILDIKELVSDIKSLVTMIKN